MRHTFLGLACALAMTCSQAEPFEPCQRPEARAQALSTGQMETFRFAVQSLSNGRFAAAYGRLRKLADNGHLPSAQLALVLYRQGSLVFGSEWDATPWQIERWSVLVGCDALRATRGADSARL